MSTKSHGKSDTTENAGDKTSDTTKGRSRKRHLTWFNPPYCMRVTSNIVKNSSRSLRHVSSVTASSTKSLIKKKKKKKNPTEIKL